MSESKPYRRDPKDLLNVMTPGDPLFTAEIADRVEWPHRTVLDNLNALAGRGLVKKDKRGPRRVLWIREQQD